MILGCLITIFAFILALLILILVGVSLTFAFLVKLLIPFVLIALGIKFILDR